MKPFTESSLLYVLPSPVCVFSASAPHTLTYANAAAEALIGASFNALQHKPVDALFFPAEHLTGLITRAAHHKSLLREFDITLACEKQAIQCNIQLLPLDNGADILVVLETKGTATALHQHMRNQSEMTQSAAHMAAILAHEIKNPLSGIRGAAQLLEETATMPDQKLTQLICTEVDRIHGLIDEMEVFSDSTPIQCQPLNIHEVLHHVRLVAEHGWARRVTFREAYDPSIPEVLGNKNLLIQMIMNLVKNAAEALVHHSSPCITLSTQYQTGAHFHSVTQANPTYLPVLIGVEDNGPGIAPHEQKSIFEPFMTTKEGGKGLGLAIAAKIAADHQGALELDTALKTGTRFKILLPACQ